VILASCSFIIPNNCFVTIGFGRVIDETLTRFGTFNGLIPAGEGAANSFAKGSANSVGLLKYR
jgi:hypothetical protein